MGLETVVWTDGSCNANGIHGRGGWAALIEQAGTVHEISGSADDTTRNRMELTAICEALETLTGPIEVRTDSAYVEKSAVSATSKVSGVTRAATRSLTIDVRLTKGTTSRLPGGYLSTTLRLFAVGKQLGRPPNTDLGSMSFTYLIQNSCAASAGCGGASLTTVTKFRGGTITAGETSNSLVVPILSGTGMFKGVTGSILIAAHDAASIIYRLTLPS